MLKKKMKNRLFADQSPKAYHPEKTNCPDTFVEFEYGAMGRNEGFDMLSSIKYSTPKIKSRSGLKPKVNQW